MVCSLDVGQEEAEQIKQESVRAAMRFFALSPMYPHQLIVRELALSEEERADVTHKFSVVLGSLGQYRALVSRQQSGRYTVEETDEEEECEALEGQREEVRRVLLTAARYLEQNLRRVERVFIEDFTPLLLQTAPYNAWWMIHLDEESCHVVRCRCKEGEGNPEYAILEP